VEIRDLRTFAVVVELGGFTRAAARLQLAQPTVSQSVARLERELGVELIERRPEGVQPTPAGSDLLRHVQIILASVERAESDMAAHRGLSKGRVKLGIAPTVTPLLMAELLRRLKEKHPGLDVHLEEAVALQLVERVRVGQIDLAVSLLPAEAPGLSIETLARYPLMIFVGSGHRLWNLTEVAIRDLKNDLWVTSPKGNPGRRWLEDACRAAGFEPHIAEEVSSAPQMRPYIEAGWGIAMMPRWAFGVQLRHGPLRPLHIVGSEHWCTVRSIRDKQNASPALALVHEEIRDIVRTAGG
jgi:DNA-binding transcriptional LysR family regulator